MRKKRTQQAKERRRLPAAEVAFGVLLLALGGVVVFAVSNPFEIAVYVGGPVLAVFGLVFLLLSAVRRSGAPRIVFGAVAVLLGSLLAVHDFLFPPGIAVSIHLGIGIATLVLGVLQLATSKSYFSKWFTKRNTQPIHTTK